MILDRVGLFVAATGPAMALLGYGVAKFRSDWRGELLWIGFLTAAIFSLVAGVAELPLFWLIARLGWPVLSSAAAEALIAGILEEAVKFAILVAIVLRHVDARRVQDVFMLSLSVALGFAAFENMLVILGPAAWTPIVSLRALTAVPAHGICGLAMGTFLAAGRTNPCRRGTYFTLALAVPMLIHAAYDVAPLAFRRDASLVWLVPFWFGTQLVAAVVTLVLCDRILPAAVALDRVSGAADQPISAAATVFGGIALIVVGPLLGTALSLLGTPGPLWGAVAVSVLPICLGVDLLATGLRRHRSYVLRSALS